jgi:hypothetical protein
MALPNRAAPAAVALPRLRHPDPAVEAWAESLVRSLDAELQRIAGGFGTTPYTLTGFAGATREADPGTASRTLNPATATATQAAYVLATVILDLQRKGTLT